MGDPKTAPVKETRTWFRSLRPLLWWLLLVLILFLYHTHARLSEKTRLKFSVTMGGKPVDYETAATLDGQSLSSGQRVKIGSHGLTLSHPKAHPFSTNLFIWYGDHDLGQIALERIQGGLQLQAVPPATRISVSGVEFSSVLTNSGGITSSVPTDLYDIKVYWANHAERRQLNVGSAGVAIRMAPDLSSFAVESDPSGAFVVASDGRTLGITPLVLSELPAGVWHGELRLDGYMPVPIVAVLAVSHTNLFRTNLVNWQYAQAMETARSAFAAGDLDQALQAVTAALKAQPNDSPAIDLRRNATIKQHLRNAEGLMVAGKFEDARREAEAALSIEPDNANAVALSKEIAKRAEAHEQKEKEEAYAQRQKRLAVAKQAVEYAFRQHEDAPLFEAHELQAAMSAHETQAAIYSELATAPAFRMKTEKLPMEGSFAIFSALEIPGGLRRCLIVGSEIETNETQIVFKVMEFKLKTFVGFQGQLTINRGYVTIDPTHAAELSDKDRNQVKQGAALVEERIRRAVGNQTR